MDPPPGARHPDQRDLERRHTHTPTRAYTSHNPRPDCHFGIAVNRADGGQGRPSVPRVHAVAVNPPLSIYARTLHAQSPFPRPNEAKQGKRQEEGERGRDRANQVRSSSPLFLTRSLLPHTRPALLSPLPSPLSPRKAFPESNPLALPTSNAFHPSQAMRPRPDSFASL
ncbi:hypothetical protein CALCODRAFT_490191 [Calocera cornea HHB12733]|uniref:Uncharacterized protein n=1 Tax=Calocera cornea HHB12733 TaxID=1353952 RepID=A0A165JWU2_9BASI|nr:hypothetical protein CALCODRAFT_490191 [Calocera cornea HHB12733]